MVLGGNVLGGCGGYIEGARVYEAFLQTIPDSAFTVITFSSESYDTDNIHSLVANTGRLTCQTDGKYAIIGVVAFVHNINGLRALELYLNGVTRIDYEGNRLGNTWQDIAVLRVSTQYHFVVGDYVELRVWQNRGGNLNTYPDGIWSPHFAMQRIG